MASIDRMSRVNNLLQQAIAEILERDVLLKDFGVIVTVSKVSTAPNLRGARVGVSFLGGSDDQKQRALNYLRKKHAVYQREMVKSVTLKYTPKLEFYYDKTVAKGDSVLRILKEDDSNE
ncbi:30S ribosome-binding factor RbfA [Lentisphaerota bacterium WC36G]|nr:30S ribosome-binding factor RbfA [Lentisphaerae bacterium WC36]